MVYIRIRISCTNGTLQAIFYTCTNIALEMQEKLTYNVNGPSNAKGSMHVVECAQDSQVVTESKHKPEG
jgi:hypothetical protein